MPVYTKGKNVYCVYYDGKRRIWEPFGQGPEARKKAEARDLEIKLKKARETWEVGRSGYAIFEDVAQAYLDARCIELAPATTRDIALILTKYVNPEIGLTNIGAVTLRDWNKIQKAMVDNGAGNRTINKNFRYLNKIFKWAVTNGYVDTNPWEPRETLKQKKYRIKLLSVDEFQKILNMAPEHLAVAMDIAYHTGARPGPKELYAMTWDNFDFANNRIRIYAPKTDTWRWQYADEAFMARMRNRYYSRLYMGDESPFVIVYRGKPVASLKKAWNQARLDAEVRSDIRFYDIRHFYITYSLAGGADILDLAERVGHVDATMIVKVYAHLVEELRSKQAFEIPKIDFPECAKMAHSRTDSRTAIKKGLTKTANPL